MKTQFGTIVKQLREKRGMDQKELGEIVGVSDKTVSSNEMIFSICETKKRLIPNNINSYWNDVTDLLLVEHLHSGASYIYNAHSNTYLTLTYDSNFMA